MSTNNLKKLIFRKPNHIFKKKILIPVLPVLKKIIPTSILKKNNQNFQLKSYLV